MKFVIMALALTFVLAGCASNLDKSYPSRYDICAMDPSNSFDPNLCNDLTDDNH